MSWTLRAIHQAFNSQDTALCRWGLLHGLENSCEMLLSWVKQQLSKALAACTPGSQLAKSTAAVAPLTMTLSGKHHISQTRVTTSVDRTEKDAYTIMHFAMFSTSISRESLLPAIYSWMQINLGDDERGQQKDNSPPPLLPLLVNLTLPKSFLSRIMEEKDLETGWKSRCLNPEMCSTHKQQSSRNYGKNIWISKGDVK